MPEIGSNSQWHGVARGRRITRIAAFGAARTVALASMVLLSWLAVPAVAGGASPGFGLVKRLGAAVDDGRRVLILASPIEGKSTTAPVSWRIRTLDLSPLSPGSIQLISVASTGTQVELEVGGTSVLLDLTVMRRWNMPFDDRAALLTRSATSPVYHHLSDAQLHGPNLPGPAKDEALDQAVRHAICAEQTTGCVVPPLVWHFVEVSPDVGLYAPCLALASDEPIRPSDVGQLARVKQDLLVLAKTEPRVAQGLKDDNGYGPLLDEYLRTRQGSVHVAPPTAATAAAEAMPRVRPSPAEVVYYHVVPFDGTWLIEYWTYWPFDTGDMDHHLHDSEHFFVEVSALGGAVQRVFGAGHGSLSGNNIYDATKPNATPIDLPIVASVEFRKHATAPEIDGDFVFTPGIDENYYAERAKVWGVRDATGINDNAIIAYERSMTITRSPRSTVVPITVADLFVRRFGLPPTETYTLLPLDEWPHVPSECDDSTTECAESQIEYHPDFLDPTNILKRWNFPHQAVRVGFADGPRRGTQTVFADVAFDVKSFAGRLVVGGGAWRAAPLAPGGDSSTCPLHCTVGSGALFDATYERFVSNIFGLALGDRSFCTTRAGLSMGEPRCGSWLTLAPFVELPIAALGQVPVVSALNHVGLNRAPGLITISGGVVLNGTATSYEFRVSVGVWAPLRDAFGAH